MKLLVIGATGGTGLEIVREATARGHQVVALVRSLERARPLLDGITLVEGDGRDPSAMERALAGCEGVISALGPPMTPFSRVTLLSEATSALLDAMERTAIRRLVCITGMGAGDSRGHGGFFYDRIFQPLLLRTIYADKDRQEAVIRASMAAWTIVRPTVLTNGPATGRIKAVTDLSNVHGGKIARADVAAFLLTELETGIWTGKAPLITSDERAGGRA